MIKARDVEQTSVKDMKYSHVYVNRLEKSFFLYQFPSECMKASELLQYRDQFYRRVLSTNRNDDTVNDAPYPMQLQTRWYDETKYAQTATRMATILKLTNPTVFSKYSGNIESTIAPTPINSLFTTNPSLLSSSSSGVRNQIDTFITSAASESARSRSRSSNQDNQANNPIPTVVDADLARRNEIIRLFSIKLYDHINQGTYPR